MRSVFFRLAFAATSVTALIPVKESSSSSLRKRDISDILQPRSEALSHYVHEDFGSGYLVQVTHSHEDIRYVSLDNLDELGGHLRCSNSPGHQRSHSRLSLTFEQPEDTTFARDIWQDAADLVFSTSHPDCDPSGERSFYAAKHIEYLATENIIQIDAETRVLSDPPATGETIRVTGGPTFNTHQPFKRQSSDASDDTYYYNGTIDLNTPFTQPEATLFTSPQFNVTCQNCNIAGQLFPAFDITIANDTSALDNLINNNDTSELANVFQDASLSAVVTQDIDVNMTLQITTIEGVTAHCSIPPTDCSASVTLPDQAQGALGKTIFSALTNPKALNIGDFKIQPSVAYGLRFGLSVTGETTLTLPFTSTTPAQSSFNLTTSSPPASNLTPTFNFGTPSASIDSATACATIALGPEASLTVSDGTGDTLLTLGGEVDIPKIVSCATPAHNVDAQCNPGPIADAVELKTNVSAGVELDATALSVFKKGTGDLLEPVLYSRNDCFGAPSGLPNGDSGSNGSNGAGSSTMGGGMSSAASGNTGLVTSYTTVDTTITPTTDVSTTVVVTAAPVYTTVDTTVDVYTTCTE